MKIQLDKDAIMPTRAHEFDAGLDLYSPVRTVIFPNSYEKIDLGVHVQTPEGHVGLITSKSGLMSEGVTCRGTIDTGYTGSIRAVVYNHGDQRKVIEKGQKVTQLVILPISLPELELVDSPDDTERGNGGFGSTGR